MFKVEIKNKLNVVTHVTTFSQEQSAIDWINSIESKPSNPWGKLERLKETRLCTEEELIESLEVISEIVGVSPELQRLPKTYEVVITDITNEYQIQQDQNQKILAGKMAREACQMVLDLIAGYNLDRQLTQQQISQMQMDFYNIDQALRASRPTTAKGLIQQIEADGVLVTSEMKASCLELLQDY